MERRIPGIQAFWRHFFLTMVCMVFFLSFCPAVHAASPVLESIGFEQKGEGEVIHLHLSTKVDPIIFEIPGERPRIVIDLQGTIYPLKKKTTIAAGGELVSQLRVGRHAKPEAKTRVVMDMVVGVNYSFIQEYHVSQKSLSVLVTKSSPERQKEHDPIEPPAEELSNSEDPDERQLQVDQHVDGMTKKTQTTSHLSETEPLPLETIEEPVSQESQNGQEMEAQPIDTQKREPKKVQEPEIILHEIRHERNSNGKEMVFFRLNGFHPPAVYSTQGDDLFVVCDFIGAIPAGKVEKRIEVSAEYIKNIITTFDEESPKVRVLIELFGSHDYDLKQVFFEEDNLFVIILSSLGEKKINKQKSH